MRKKKLSLSVFSKTYLLVLLMINRHEEEVLSDGDREVNRKMNLV